MTSDRSHLTPPQSLVQATAPFAASLGLLLIGLLAVSPVLAQDTPAKKPKPPAAGKQVKKARPADEKQAPGAKSKVVPLNEAGTVLLDVPGQRVLVKGEVVLRQGGLEMFLCRKRSKEHESIVAVDADAFVIHTGLLALKAAPGGPAEYEPEFKPPHGQKLKIQVTWTDEQGKSHQEPAHNWIREMVNRFWTRPLEQLPQGVDLPENSALRYDHKQRELLWYGPMTEAQRKEFKGLSQDKEWGEAIEYFFERGQSRGMKADWVFVGSILHVDETTGQRGYAAEEGMYICVSNFATAMIDIAEQSSDAKASLSYEAWTERIPPKGTPVVIEISPIFDEPKELKAAEQSPPAKSPPAKSAPAKSAPAKTGDQNTPPQAGESTTGTVQVDEAG